MKTRLRENIFSITDLTDFSGIALETLTYQYERNPLYRSFMKYLGKTPWDLKRLDEIPFMPIEFFRNHPVITGAIQIETIFESSGTSGSITSKHFVRDLKLYEESFLTGFRQFYGDPGNYIIAALLPSYTERAGSSLVYMVEKLISESGHALSGFYKDNMEELISNFGNKRYGNRKLLLIGVTFALLDLAEKYSPDLSGAIIMETGGMKGRRKELTRGELHSILKKKLHVDAVHSEYGMTELLSQAYSKGNGVFRCPPWMKVLIRDPQDPMSIITEPGRTGGINIIDLANLHSCSFLATSDLGKVHEDGSFEILGRFDYSDIRGCNLMVE